MERIIYWTEDVWIVSAERVRDYFLNQGMEERIITCSDSIATVALAARALGCEPSRIAKTLAFDAGDRVLLVVAAGDVRVDNRKFKEQFAIKPRMLARDETETRTGHPAGGVCPFAVSAGASVYLDVSLQRFATVFPACGSSSSAIELSLPELQQHARSAGWVDVCKPG
jgi:prolyl-tRNA editing enzyme YbaK/EbsC (Cys-tRNA(Pro) deacylase)